MSKGMYSCLKCRKQVKSFEELSSSQQLCKSCRVRYPMLTCKFCRSDFHYMSEAPIGDKDPVCTKCTEYLDRFGKPRVCSYCNLLAAFKGDLCHRCQASQKKYGSAIPCQQCRVKCAFKKPSESRQKVGDQVLCFVCTVAYKKAQHRSVKRKSDGQDRSKDSASMPIVTTVQVAASGTTTITAAVSSVEPRHVDTSMASSSSSPPALSNTLVPPPKKRKFANGSSRLSSPVTTAAPSALGGVATSAQPSSTGTTPVRASDANRAPLAFSHLMDDPMNSLEMVNTLTEKVALLQKQVKDRDQQLLEKDKKATEYKADVRGTEKSLRTKIAALQKQLESSQSECYSLRRQVSVLNSSKATKGKQKDSGYSRAAPRDGKLFSNHIVKREVSEMKDVKNDSSNNSEKESSSPPATVMAAAATASAVATPSPPSPPVNDRVKASIIDTSSSSDEE